MAYTPRKQIRDNRLDTVLAVSAKIHNGDFPMPTVYLVDQVNGKCFYGRNKEEICDVLIPLFAFKNGIEYLTYYIAHEFAHAWVYSSSLAGDIEWPGVNYHGPEFMKRFKLLCPSEYWHYELSYKPKLAKAAGITGTK